MHGRLVGSVQAGLDHGDLHQPLLGADEIRGQCKGSGAGRPQGHLVAHGLARQPKRLQHDRHASVAGRIGHFKIVDLSQSLARRNEQRRHLVLGPRRLAAEALGDVEIVRADGDHVLADFFNQGKLRLHHDLGIGVEVEQRDTGRDRCDVVHIGHGRHDIGRFAMDGMLDTLAR